MMHTLWQAVLKYKSYIFIGLIILLALKVFIPQLDALRDSIAALKNANLSWVLLGVVVFFAGLPILTWQYMVLALKPIYFWLTFKVEVAGLFVSKLLPSSLGTIGLNYYYFVQQKHSAAQASTVMAINGITSGIAYMLLIIVSMLLSDFHFGDIASSVSIPIWGIVAIIAGVAIVSFALYRVPAINNKVKSFFADLSASLLTYKQKPSSLIFATLYNGIGSFTSLFALYASAHAMGIDLTIAQALLAYTFGNIAAGLVPTPGGIGAAEAGIYSGLVIVGVESSDALVVTLLYRFISYWLPIVPGYISFAGLRKDVLANFSIKQQSPEKPSTP